MVPGHRLGSEGSAGVWRRPVLALLWFMLSAVMAHAATGTVVIRQETGGDDAVFGFTSPEAALNLSIGTLDGAGEAGPIELAAGVHEIVAEDMSGAGYALTGISCSDGDSVAEPAARRALIVLNAGETVTCTFSSVNSRERTEGLVEDFLGSRANLLVGALSASNRRIDRIDGAMRADIDKAINRLIRYMPNFVGSRRVLLSTSLATLDAFAGARKASPFDAWFDVSFTLFDAASGADTSLVAVGLDYLVTPELLAGVYVQGDRFRQPANEAGRVTVSDGWLIGPYVTARLDRSLYLDVVAGTGGSFGQMATSSGAASGFDATRWLANVSLSGQWSAGNWTFTPRARFGYSEAVSQAWLDALGVPVPSVTEGSGQIAVGPGVTHRVETTEDFDIQTSVRFEGVVDVSHDAIGWSLRNPSGRIEGGLGIGFPQGANVNLTGSYDGIGAPHATRATGKVRLSLPLQ
ncbi:hypothetical protein VE25_04070 [Devosia geojensis]|uniref:Autotransporter domain-containing protein n=1 Tax=Devosia geojensis TaxID=443610 RepID=A0A0F5FW27_9HYPH|nr:hypothetical protein VE25_04070 [Devosia geojensis]